MNIKYATLVFTFFIYNVSKAQLQKYTLQQCIEYAWNNNLDIKQSFLNNESSVLDVKQSKANLLPTLSASAGQNYQFGRTVDRFTNAFVNQTIRSNNFGLNAGLSLFNGFQNQNNIVQKKQTQKVSQYTIDVTKNQIALSIANSFLQCIQAIETINFNNIQIQNTTQRIERAQKMVDAGVSDLTILLSLKAQLANEKLNLINSESAKNASILSLKNLMQLPIENHLEIIVPLISDEVLKFTKADVFEIYEIALKNLPQIKAAETQILAAKAQTKMANGNLFPSIALYGSVSTVFSQSAKEVVNTSLIGTSPIGYTQTSNEVVLKPIYDLELKTIKFGKQLESNLGQGAGINLSWNLFNGFATQNQIQKAKINQTITDLNFTKTKNTLLSDINIAVNTFNAAKVKFDASENNVEAQTTSLEYIQKRFDAGVSNSFDFINAKNNYSQAKSSALQAKYELIFRALILEYYKGNIIQL